MYVTHNCGQDIQSSNMGHFDFSAMSHARLLNTYAKAFFTRDPQTKDPCLLLKTCKAKFLPITITCQGNGLIPMSEENA